MSGFLKESVRAELLGGTLMDHKTHLTGYCRGYYVTLYPAPEGGMRLGVNASRPEDVGNVALGAFLEQYRTQAKTIRTVRVQPGRFELALKPVSFRKLPAVVNGLMEPILSHLSLNGYTSGCGCCGSSAAPVACWQVNGEIYPMCDACAEQIGQSLREGQEQVRAQKSNLIAGLVGAFLGALVGGIVWVLITKLGYIAGLAGLVMGVCSIFGYKKLGGCLDRKGVVACIVVVALMIFASNKIAWSWAIYDEVKEYGLSFFDIYTNLGDILAEAECTGSFYLDLIVGYVLTALVSWGQIRNALRASSGAYTFRKLK